MILPYDISPDKSLYVIGAEVLGIFKEENSEKIDVKVLFDKLNQLRRNKVSFNYFLYALDWLFLTETIYSQENYIALCS